MIRVENLTVRFGQGANAITAVDGVSFTVAPGEVFGLVGESGCGKSTILRALSGLSQHWQGTIEIAGAPVAPKRTRAFYKAVQMVFQDPYGSLHPKHTVETTLAEPAIVHQLSGISERIDRVLRQVGLARQFRFRYPHQLSGGQRQRVAIARALILEPQILLLDEPTSALDVSVQAEVLNLLTDLRQTAGLTYVLVSHDFGVIAHMCDRLAVMNHGRILEHLALEDLLNDRMTDPYTRRLYAASAGYDRAQARAEADG